jgi:hypothetical protein
MAQEKAGEYNPKYKTAIGVKVLPFAVTWKNFSIRQNRAFEFLADFKDVFRMTGLYKQQ